MVAGSSPQTKQSRLSAFPYLRPSDLFHDHGFIRR